ncbi:metallophosphoesterase family protein [Spirulina major]|uniref:metallophosphoesterase family protein n=1 Tax=Spirulina major TaxID=270636 RepID=UPI000932C949|nr:metallophosphoesterase [Spirulina major]
MSRLCRFAIASDLHIALPHTIDLTKPRFHLVEASVPALEAMLAHLEQLDLDCLFIPGDLTQDGERDNHHWLIEQLQKVSFPVYVIPGNHDVVKPTGNDAVIGLDEFAALYQPFGYDDPQQLWYSREIAPGVQLVGLNSNQFDATGWQLGCLDQPQWEWLRENLPQWRDRFVIVMIHHNIVEHIPQQSTHPLGRRYMLDDAAPLRHYLNEQGVRLVLTGHLHIQDVAEADGITEILTGSLVGYPHPYRVLELHDDGIHKRLKMKSYRLRSLPGWEDLPAASRQRTQENSFPFMSRFVSLPPLNLKGDEMIATAHQLQSFWADMAEGDRTFSFPQFPPHVRSMLEAFSATHPIDNNATLRF